MRRGPVEHLLRRHREGAGRRGRRGCAGRARRHPSTWPSTGRRHAPTADRRPAPRAPTDCPPDHLTRRIRPIAVAGSRVRGEGVAEADVEVDRAAVRRRDAAQHAPSRGGEGTAYGRPVERAHGLDRLRCREVRRPAHRGAEDARAASVVWLAPVPRSSCGRSAERTTSGTPVWWASSTAGCRLATAVPDVVMTGTGAPEPLARPEGEEAGGALVDPDVQAEATVALGLLDGIREGCGARPRCEDDVTHTTADQLVDEDASERGGGVHQLPEAGGPTRRATPVSAATATTPTTAASAGLAGEPGEDPLGRRARRLAAGAEPPRTLEQAGRLRATVEEDRRERRDGADEGEQTHAERPALVDPGGEGDERRRR